MTKLAQRLPATLLAAACMLATAAQAQTTFQLRVMALDTVMPYQTTNTIGSQGQDKFINGNPLSGMVYQPLLTGAPNGGPVTGGYAVFGAFSPGRELTGPDSDFLGTNLGIGRLSFAAADAALNNTNLTLAGSSVASLGYRPVPPSGSALGLVQRTSGFEYYSVFNYSAMLPGESIQVALGGSGGTDYVDRLQLRYGTAFATGLPFINFETQASTSGVLARSALGSTTPTAVYANLAGVAYMALGMYRDMPTSANPNPGVQATVTFFGAALDTNGNPVHLADYTFATSGQTFQGSGDFQSVFTSATWTTAVPEPTPAALLAMGLAGLALRRFNARPSPVPASR